MGHLPEAQRIGDALAAELEATRQRADELREAVWYAADQLERAADGSTPDYMRGFIYKALARLAPSPEQETRE
jgi:hypothetical protein